MTNSAYNTSTYNIRATLTAWVTTVVATYAPALAADGSVVREEPEQPLTMPIWAVDFPSLLNEYNYTGRIVGSGERGAMNLGMMRVVMYASRDNVDWRAELAQMADAVRKGFYSQANAAIIILDFGTTPNAPTSTSLRVVLESIDQASFPVSLNPDIQGAALFITYRYVERVQI